MKSKRNEKIITDKVLRQFYRMLIEEEKSPATVAKYMHDVADFASFARRRKITKMIAIEYKQAMSADDRYASRSINTRLAVINSFFKHMGWNDCTVKALKIQPDAFRDAERELSKAEYERLLRTAKEKGKERICLVMQTICATGIRVSELSYITVEAVRSGHAEIRMKGKIRKILIPADLQKLLILYIRKSGRKTGSIFVTRNGRPLDRSNICHEMKALCEAAGIEKSKVFPHNLRHLFACTYLDQDNDVNTLADLLGHNNINTTRIYTQKSTGKLMKHVNRMKLAEVVPWSTETGFQKMRQNKAGRIKT